MPDRVCGHVCQLCGGCERCCPGHPGPDVDTSDDDQAAPGPHEPGTSTAEQRLAIVTLMSDLGIQGRGGRLQICSDMAGRRIESALDLSFAEAGAILTQLTSSKERMAAQ